MKGILTFISSEMEQDEKLLLNLFIRTEEGKRQRIIVKDFKLHFCFKNKISLIALASEECKLEKIEEKSLFGDSLLRITYSNPKDTSKLKDLFYNNFEADVSPIWRYLIDENIYSGVEFDEDSLVPCQVDLIPFVVYFDIEVLQSKLSIEGDEVIASISLNTNFDDTFKVWDLKSYKDERKMLLNFQRYLKKLDPDILAGWNISGYDIPYLFNRCKKLGVKRMMDWNYYNGKTYCKTREIFDLDKGYRKLHLGELSSYSLGHVAKSELGKVKREVGNNAIKLWQENPDELIDMNKQHVLLTKELDKECGIIDYFWDLKNIAGFRLSDAIYNSMIADMLLLRKAKELGIVLPTKKKMTPFKYEGSYVFIIKGIYDDVFIFDFEAMYPSIIKQFNISPETKILIDEKLSFNREKIGLVPQIFDELLKKRKELKKEMEKSEGKEKRRLFRKQETLKFVTNSVYGIFGYSEKHSNKYRRPAPRLVDKDCAETITAFGRALIKFLKIEFEIIDIKPIAGDTDSIFLLNISDIEKTLRLINDELIPRFLKNNGIETESLLKVAFKRKFPRLLIKAKKNYAGLDENGELKVKGLGYVKSDTSELASDIQHSVLLDILNQNAQIVDNLKEKIDNVINQISALNWFKIARATKLRKELNGYEANAPHVRAALYSNQYLGTSFQKENKVLWAWVIHPKTDVIAFDYGVEISDEYKPDRRKLIDEIRLKTEPLLEMIKLQFPYKKSFLIDSNYRKITDYVV